MDSNEFENLNLLVAKIIYYSKCPSVSLSVRLAFLYVTSKAYIS